MDICLGRGATVYDPGKTLGCLLVITNRRHGRFTVRHAFRAFRVFRGS